MSNAVRAALDGTDPDGWNDAHERVLALGGERDALKQRVAELEKERAHLTRDADPGNAAILLLRQAVNGVGEHEFVRPGGWRERAIQVLTDPGRMP